MNITVIEDDGFLYKFDAFCRKVVRHKAYNEYRDEKRNNRHAAYETSINDYIMDQLFTEDAHEVFVCALNLHDFTVFIENELLYAALKRLSEKRLEIILLSYFMGFSDKEISAKLQLAKSTVQYNRVIALKKLRKIMEEMKRHGN